MHLVHLALNFYVLAHLEEITNNKASYSSPFNLKTNKGNECIQMLNSELSCMRVKSKSSHFSSKKTKKMK